MVTDREYHIAAFMMATVDCFSRLDIPPEDRALALRSTVDLFDSLEHHPPLSEEQQAVLAVQIIRFQTRDRDAVQARKAVASEQC